MRGEIQRSLNAFLSSMPQFGWMEVSCCASLVLTNLLQASLCRDYATIYCAFLTSPFHPPLSHNITTFGIGQHYCIRPMASSLRAGTKRTYDELLKCEKPVNGDSRDTAADTDEEPDDIVSPYDVDGQEKLPKSAVYTQEYEDLRAKIKSLVELLREPIDRATYRDGTIDGLLDEITKRTTSTYPQQIRIALVGDMSSGKSTVINSILNVGTIARQGDGGGSCTWVVQEFCCALEGQKRPFAADVFFFSTEEQHAIIRKMLADYYRVTKAEEDVSDHLRTNEEITEDFMTKQAAMDTFRSLFANQKEFVAQESAMEFLGMASAPDDEWILGKLYDWSNDAMADFSDYGYRRVEAATPQDLLRELSPYMFTQKTAAGDPVCSVWSVVSKIRFGLSNRLLANDITMVDLPGLSDANRTRAANAYRELQSCTHYMIVAPIGRSTDDKTIRSLMAEGYGSRGAGRTILVLTHADTIDPATEVYGSVKEMKQMEKLSAELQVLEAELTAVSKKIQSAKGTSKYQFYEVRDKVGSQISKLDRAYNELRIGIRSRTTSAKMQDLYFQLTGDVIPLQVFCVGNEAYRKHQAGYRMSVAPTLSVEGTNIPALRSHLFLAPAESKLNDARHMVDIQLPTLLKCFNLYCSKTHMARKAEIEAVVAAPQETAKTQAKELFTKFHQQLEKSILAAMVEKEGHWADDAVALCKDWAKKYSVHQYFQFLKQDGVRNIKGGRGKPAERVSWNEELIVLSAAELRSRFDACIRDLPGFQKNVVSCLGKLVSDMAYSIRNDPQVTVMALKPFLDYVLAEKENIEPFVEEVFRQLRRGMGSMQSAVSSDSPDNPIGLAMQPVYAEVKLMKLNAKGTLRATPVERARRFEEKVTTVGSSVWLKAHDKLKRQIKNLLQGHLDLLRGEAVNFLADMVMKFNLMCASEDHEDPEEDQLREELRTSLAKANVMLEVEVKAAAVACFKRI
ncbi:hypothetical protein AC579_3846 [Pseudocercospora musae]|uniref:G domain-containing protein n=1 Tax=Pseudocercospora musae TaxID=113226 RepID=A0A139IS17_9PEZI|nr:hypothetical protein AC579_3846 [Pseudocercospora musae]KXT17349.1 hypothetical protein AC579_3846 [Pseudocercospora musae]KXT17351.1 hypothetical protein AC579_3846 [Pseudocercospora musae]